MSVSILEALQSAEFNLYEGDPVNIIVAKTQLHNAIILLEKGYNIHTLIEPLLKKWGIVADVPEIDDNDDINQDD